MKQYCYQRRNKGIGPVLVLLHGFLCGPEYWRNTVKALCNRFDVITPNLPGFAGFTSHAALNRIDGFVDYLLNLLDYESVQKFHLLGHSMGGMIAQELAIKAGNRIDRLVLFGTGPIGEMPGRFESLEKSLRRVTTQGPDDTIENTVATWFMRGREDPEFANVVATAKLASIDAIVGGYKAMQNWRIDDRLDDIRNLTLIIWGDGDRSYSRNQVELLRNGILNSRLVIMQGCSHNAHLEKPDLFHQHVANFLSK